jgi:hypothetical protein
LLANDSGKGIAGKKSAFLLQTSGEEHNVMDRIIQMYVHLTGPVALRFTAS